MPDAVADRAMEPDVVQQKRLRVVERREHAGDFIGDGGQVGVGRAIGGEAGDADFERAPRLEHLAPREPVERREKTERLAVEHGRPVGDERAGAVTDDDDAFGGERLQPGADAGAADADGADELALGRQPLAAAEVPAHDEAAHVLGHELGGQPRVLDRPAALGRAEMSYQFGPDDSGRDAAEIKRRSRAFCIANRRSGELSRNRENKRLLDIQSKRRSYCATIERRRTARDRILAPCLRPRWNRFQPVVGPLRVATLPRAIAFASVGARPQHDPATQEDPMPYTRREAGKLALTALPAVAFLRGATPAFARAQKPNSKFAGVLVGLNVPYNFGMQSEWPADRILKAVVDLGVSGLELRAQPIEIFAGARQGARLPDRHAARHDTDARTAGRTQAGGGGPDEVAARRRRWRRCAS